MRGLFVIAAVLSVGSLLSSGCRTAGVQEPDLALQDLPAVPYAVELRIPAGARDFPYGGLEDAKAPDGDLESSILASIQQTLNETSTFSRVFTIGDEPRDRLARFGIDWASHRSVRGADADLIVTLDVTRTRSVEDVEAIADAGRVAGSAFLWLYGIFPSFFVADRVFEPLVHAEVRVRRADDPPTRELRHRLTLEPIALRFYERVGSARLIAGLIVPPAFVPTDDPLASREILERNVQQLASLTASFLKRRLPLEEVRASEPFLSLPGAAGRVGFLFAPSKLTSFALAPRIFSASEMDELDSAQLRDDERIATLERLRRYLLQLSGEEPPTLAELEARYPRVYALRLLSGIRGSARVEATFAPLGESPPRLATWTLPGDFGLDPIEGP